MSEQGQGTTTQGTPEKPEAALPEDKLWEQAQKDRSTPAEQAAPVAGKTVDGKPEDKRPDQVDALAGLPEPTRKLIEALQTKQAEQDDIIKKQAQGLATARGTLGGMKQQLDASQEALKRLTPTMEAVEADKKAAAVHAATEKAGRRKAAREALGSILEQDVVDEVLPDVQPGQDEAERARAEEERRKASEAAALTRKTDEPSDVEVASLLIALHEAHPGWKQTKDSAPFQGWLKTLPTADQQRFNGSFDVPEVVGFFQAFDKHQEDAAKVARLEAERKARLERGENIQGRNSAGTGEAPSKDALWEQAKRDRAKAQSA